MKYKGDGPSNFWQLVLSRQRPYCRAELQLDARLGAPAFHKGSL